MSITFTSDDDLDQLQASLAEVGIHMERRRRSSILLGQQVGIGKEKEQRRSSIFRAVSVRDVLKAVEEDDASDDDSHVTPTSTEPADKIDRAYDATTLKGKPDGLFRACMEAIRSSHHEARQIRTALILIGLFTDKDLYKEWLAVFYAVNLDLENKLKSADFEKGLGNDENELKILKKLQQLGEMYYFTELYEKDLQLLYGVNSRDKLLKKVASCLANKPNAREYQAVVKNMTTSSDLAGALFCLWGVFIVGGGSMARQRAVKMCGEEGVNVYQNVSGPGREKRKQHFIELWDGLADAVDGTKQFKVVEESSELCIKLMNATIKDLSANPWWLKWVSFSAVALIGGIIAVAANYFLKKSD